MFSICLRLLDSKMSRNCLFLLVLEFFLLLQSEVTVFLVITLVLLVLLVKYMSLEMIDKFKGPYLEPHISFIRCLSISKVRTRGKPLTQDTTFVMATSFHLNEIHEFLNHNYVMPFKPPAFAKERWL